MVMVMMVMIMRTSGAPLSCTPLCTQEVESTSIAAASRFATLPPFRFTAVQGSSE